MTSAASGGAPRPVRLPLTRPAAAPWNEPGWWPGLDAATAELDPPFGVIAQDALAANAFDLLDRARGLPIRVASKSIRVRAVLDAVLALPGYAGVLAYTLPEALWLAENGVVDAVVGYPTAHRAGIRQLATSDSLSSRVTLMVDDPSQLDLVDAVIPPAKRREVRVALELDASFHSRVLGRLGVLRSPVRTPAEARALAEHIVARPGFRLVGMMAYEAQIAGVGNAGTGRGNLVRAMQRSSANELRERRSEAVRLVREVAQLEFVNGGGTGSIESTHADESVTEVAAGSGLFGPHLFDHYTHFHPAPAASFALSVVRVPDREWATVLGGGWIASGPPANDRLPLPVWPEGLQYAPREAAGEVQSPVRGGSRLTPGDRVWFRHTKAGELSEHLASFALVKDGSVVDELPTYRGEGKAFL